MLKPHDPTHFERVLRQRVAHPLTLAQLECNEAVTV
jgi:homoserine kinase type II